MRYRLLAIAFIWATFMAVSGRTTYIPTYYAQINMECDGGMCKVDSTCRRELTMYASDGRYSITVLHDSVTLERVKAIKSMKAAAGWATASAVLSGVSATLRPVHTSWDAVRYMNDMHHMSSSSMLAAAARIGAADLQKVNISIVIENFSDREMVVSDMSRGLTWFVRAHTYISLDVGNPEVNNLRIAYAEDHDQKKDYVTVQACNYLDKETVAYEDENEWIVSVYDSNPQTLTDTLIGYRRINKISFVCENMDIDTFKKYKKAKKNLEKNQ